MLISGRTLGQWFLLSLFAVILYFCFRIMQPFLIPIVLALILSTLLDPLYETLAIKMKDRRNIAAIVVCAALTVAILIPALFLSLSLAREANDAYKQVRDPDTLNKITSWLDPSTNPTLGRIQPWLPSSLRIENIGAQIGSQAQRIGVAILGVATSFAAGLFSFLMDYIIMLVVLFFLLRDSDYFAQRVRNISPLSRRQENLFVERFRRVARATVNGSLLTAQVQGTISGSQTAQLS
jgi:predicted PurR-regulated permease PerM